MRKKADKPKQPQISSFAATFALEADSARFAQLEKRLNAYRQVYNAMLGELARRLKRGSLVFAVKIGILIKIRTGKLFRINIRF